MTEPKPVFDGKKIAHLMNEAQAWCRIAAEDASRGVNATNVNMAVEAAEAYIRQVKTELRNA